MEPEARVAALRAHVVAVRGYVHAGRGLERESRCILPGDEVRDGAQAGRRDRGQQRVQRLDAAPALDERVAATVALRRADQISQPDCRAAVLLRAGGRRREPAAEQDYE